MGSNEQLGDVLARSVRRDRLVEVARRLIEARSPTGEAGAAADALAEVLENIAGTVRERRRIRAEVFALTTGPRVSSYVLCGIPILLLVAFCLMNAEYRQVMLGSRIGHSMIGFAAIWSMIGLFFTQKVAKVEY